ncbi:MAG: tetratricopeptide repeat protein [Bacteroidales bacterium]|nr:tetratricopeptide repeat protein [Bacteroidales bacterium]
MHSTPDRDIIIDFLFDTILPVKKSEVADKIINDENFRNLYNEEKDRFIIHSYVNNELEPHEHIEFENRLKKDKQLSKEVALLKDIDLFSECNALKDIQQEYMSGKNNHMHFLKNNKVSVLVKNNSALSPITVRKIKKWIAAASIAFLLISGGEVTQNYFLTRGSLENRLYETYYETFDKTGQYDLNTNSLKLAQLKYTEGEYENALLSFQNLPTSLSIEAEKHFFIGLSFMELKLYRKAIENFEQVTKSPEGIGYLAQTQWYIGLSYLKTGNKEKAIDIFKVILSYNDCNYKKAKKILKKLER